MSEIPLPSGFQIAVSLYAYFLPLMLYAAWSTLAFWDLSRRSDLSTGATIGWIAAILLLPSHASTLAVTNGVHRTAVVGSITNSARKGDRLVSAHTTNEEVTAAPAAKKKRIAKIPVGCEAAFSRVIKSNNFAVRCVTGIQLRTKLA